MSTDPIKAGRGSGHFLLGTGPAATGGDVEIELRCFPAPNPAISVEWKAPWQGVPVEAQKRIISYIERYLRGYLELHPVGSLHVTVVGAGWFTDRHNEPERAAWIALHYAIVNAKLPPPPLYAPPDSDETAP
jgi:hypothetical protein